jgi:acyl-homoserine-lactone acylase
MTSPVCRWDSHRPPGAPWHLSTRRIHNSFVAAVEFGPTVHAKAILSGGESGDPASPHFTDQALMFTQGKFRDVLFYPQEVLAHAERSYHP